MAIPTVAPSDFQMVGMLEMSMAVLLATTTADCWDLPSVANWALQRVVHWARSKDPNLEMTMVACSDEPLE